MRRWPLFIVLSLAARAADARADTAPVRDPAAAEALFDEGRALLKAGRNREACAKFEASQTLDPAVGTLFNTATCALDDGRLATAWLRYRQAAALAHERADDREPTAVERARALEPRVPKLVVRVASAPPGLRLAKDGVELASGALATPIPADPGDVRIEATAPGFEPWSTVVRATEGHLTTVDVPALGRSDARHFANEAPLRTWQRPASYAALGAGALALGAGAFFGVRASNRWSDVDRTCPGGDCPDEATRTALEPAHDAASRDASLATACIVGGIVVAVAGVVLFVTSPSSTGARPRVGASF